jgi:hypothetical protein
MNTQQLEKPLWSDGYRFMAALTGSTQAKVMLQVFDDRGEDGRLAEWRYGRLTDQAIQKWLVVKIKAGCGVFVTINRTDGTGRRRQNVTHYLASFIDLDGKELPTRWPIQPDIIIESSAGRYHVYWLLEPGTDLALWEDTQARLAAYYGGDKKVTDAARVMRVPGFFHQKAELFRTRILECVDPEQVRLNCFDRATINAIIDTHPCEYNAPVATPRPLNPPKDVEFDTEANLARAQSYIDSREPPETGRRNNEAYAAACKLNDMAISPAKSLELLQRWNERLSDPLRESELERVIESASNYKQNPPGVDAVVDDEFEGKTQQATNDGGFEQQTVVKLNNINQYNIHQHFRMVNLNGKMRVVWWARSALDPKVRVPQFWSVREFKTALANKYYLRTIKRTDRAGEEKIETIEIPLADWWLKTKKRYTHDGVVLQTEMDSDSPDAINLWRGYGVEENPTGDWGLLFDHLRQVIANGKQDRFDYIIRWIAWALQNPDKPCEVALILKSATHGTGKGMLLRAIRKLFGAHAMQISKGGLLTGRFNAHLAMTCFLFVDEMTLANDKESATLNSTLTEDAIPIEPKGVDAYMMPNHVKVAAASNQEHVVLVAGSDRRFMVFEVSDKRARDGAYFKAINDQLENGGYGRMLHDLLQLDLNGWHPRNTDGCVDDKNPEKVRSAPPEIEWLAGYLDHGVLDCTVGHRGGSQVHAGEFYEHARRSTRALAGWSNNKFATFLKAWDCTRIRSHTSIWQFPPLDEMRQTFRAKFSWWPAFDDAIEDWHDGEVIEVDEERVVEPDFG